MIEQAQFFIEELDEVLELERSALVQGRLDELQDLLERKDLLISELNALEELEKNTLTDIHLKVSRNQQLLESAMQGIRSVAVRMQELRKVRKGLDVYDKSGRKNSYSTSTSLKLEKRA